ncbi:hypothetical protein Dsin_024612 [Dipteronia sinensis]|uniref:F-box domain-containing protein n=1 Tax=Dipteronia sinensis TaxID=43782 RepID=A0AAD9ZUT5_9ROSI|nr:hypothetical protein Dsin_024612 [Dipteronia sinensis]
MSSSNFPSDLIVDVVSYLPVKSLCRFKCVSKSWLALITHPQFVKLHHARTQRQIFLLAIDASLYHVDFQTSLLQQEPSLSLPSSSSYRKVVPIKHDLPFKEEHDRRNFRLCSWVSESSNGLFCTLMLDPPDREFFIYNPSNREYKKIPYIESEKEFPTLHGFGYAESIDDYKFVKVLIKRNIIQIFSLRNNSWKTIKCDFPFNVKIPLARSTGWEYGIPLDRSIHWVVDVVLNRPRRHRYDDYYYHPYQHRSKQIVAFDLVEEKFKTLPILDQVFQNVKRLTVLEDRLCIINNRDQFWIMKKYGAKKSWTRILIPKKPYQGRCSSKDSRNFFLKVKDNRYLLVNLDDDKYTAFDGNKCYTKHVYVENLVSPNFHTDVAVASEGINNFTRL